jgi:hypothetical protein
MSETKNASQLWYTRRDGVVKGPFPAPLISSYILLGRLNEKDELSNDGEHWGPIANFPELMPEVMKNVQTEEDRQRLELARMRVDERLAEKRLIEQRAREREVVAAEWEGPERRADERRRPESESTVRHREHRRKLLEEMGGRAHQRHPYVVPLLLVLIFSGLLFSFYQLWQQLSSIELSEPDCNLQPAPGVNWSYCQMQKRSLRRQNLSNAEMTNINLQGADLQGADLSNAKLDYADLSGANLGFTNLRGASLRGAVLVNANLSGADVSAADLAYANLQGANLSGSRLESANLTKAYWTDGRICAVGSLGQCH